MERVGDPVSVSRRTWRTLPENPQISATTRIPATLRQGRNITVLQLKPYSKQHNLKQDLISTNRTINQHPGHWLVVPADYSVQPRTKIGQHDFLTKNAVYKHPTILESKQRQRQQLRNDNQNSGQNTINAGDLRTQNRRNSDITKTQRKTMVYKRN